MFTAIKGVAQGKLKKEIVIEQYRNKTRNIKGKQ